MLGPDNIQGTSTTSVKVVLPFYLYAAVAFIVAAILLLMNADVFTGHYFTPRTLALTHVMALGWGTMMILGASHQLVPVLTGSSLYSNRLGLASFFLAAIGIPLLVYGFYTFRMGDPAKWGGRLVLLSITCYMINLIRTMRRGKGSNVHASFVLTSVIWLFFTVFYGLVLVYDFTTGMLPESTVHYLPLHAHTGIIGWFMMLIMGVGSRLIPMFMISKYTNDRLLWRIYSLVNGALLLYVLLFHIWNREYMWLIPLAGIGTAVGMFILYLVKAYRVRIRKNVDRPMQISLGSSGFAVVLVILLLAVVLLGIFTERPHYRMVYAYGFVIFFGWITAIILGMTFKTLPFILWNRLYRKYGADAIPGPREFFSDRLVSLMTWSYVIGFIVFLAGIFLGSMFVMHTGGVFMLIAAVLYGLNVFGMLAVKPSRNE